MSFGGILAQALAGGTAAIGKQAGDDIEAQRKADLMRQEADIREQTEKRLIEFRSNTDRIANKNKLIDTRDFTSADETLAASDKIARATGATNRAVQTETAGDEMLNTALRKKAEGDALSKAETDKLVTHTLANDPIYLGDVKRIKLADPEVAQRIAASAASAAEARERTEGLKLANADKRELDNLYGQAKTVLMDSTITDEERAKRFGKVQAQIGLIKSKNGQIAPRDPELDTQTITDEKINPDGTTTKTVRKEVRKPGNGTAAAPGAPAVGTEVNGYVFKGGDPNDKKNWTPKAGAKPAGGVMLQSVKPEPDYRPASDGSGRMVDVTTGRTLTPEQSAVLAKIERGEPTTPGERALLNN